VFDAPMRGSCLIYQSPGLETGLGEYDRESRSPWLQ